MSQITRKSFYSPFRRPWFTPLRTVLDETRDNAERFMSQVGEGNVVSVTENVWKGRGVVTVWFREADTKPKAVGFADDQI